MPQTAVMAYRDSSGKVPIDEWLDELSQKEPKAWEKCQYLIIHLSNFGYEARRPLADSLRDGIHELRAKVGKVNYRILYFFHGSNAVVLSHGLTKESKVPDAEIDRAVRRMGQVKRAPERHIAEWDIDD